MIFAATSGGNPSAITTAVIALAGVVVGGFIASGTQFAIERRHARREADADRLQLRTAARMMAVDLARAWSNLELAERTGRWWRTKGLSPRMSASDRRLVIGSLTDEGFYNVDRAESAVDYWYGIRDHAITESPRLADSYKQEDLTRVLGWIEAAQATLREITGDPIELAREPRAARQTVD